jgi:hypothetical protein
MNLLTIDDLPNEVVHNILTFVEDHTCFSMTSKGFAEHANRFVKAITNQYEFVIANDISIRRFYHEWLIKFANGYHAGDSYKQFKMYINLAIEFIDCDDAVRFKMLCLCTYKSDLEDVIQELYNYWFDETQFVKIFDMLCEWSLIDRKILNYQLIAAVNTHVYEPDEMPFRLERIEWLLSHGANPLYGVLGGFSYNDQMFERDLNAPHIRFCYYAKIAYQMVKNHYLVQNKSWMNS